VYNSSPTIFLSPSMNSIYSIFGSSNSSNSTGASGNASDVKKEFWWVRSIRWQARGPLSAFYCNCDDRVSYCEDDDDDDFDGLTASSSDQPPASEGRRTVGSSSRRNNVRIVSRCDDDVQPSSTQEESGEPDDAPNSPTPADASGSAASANADAGADPALSADPVHIVKSKLPRTVTETKRKSLHDRLERYLQSKGLEEKDVPKVLGWFVVVKYSTWLVFVCIGIRCQPLTKAFRRARVKGRARFIQELERIDHMESDYAKRFKQADKRRKALKEWRSNVSDSMQKQRQTMSKRMLRHRDILTKKDEPGWYRWVGDKYNHHSQNLADKLASYESWTWFAQALHQNPQSLAIGAAEGVILYKMTFVITAPISLWIITKFFQKGEDRRSGDHVVQISKLREFSSLHQRRMTDAEKSEKVRDQSWLSSA